MNEFRMQLKDQGATFATKVEMDSRAQLVDQRLDVHDNRFSSMDGSMKVFAGVYGVA
jgi:hypothetical protein